MKLSHNSVPINFYQHKIIEKGNVLNKEFAIGLDDSTILVKIKLSAFFLIGKKHTRAKHSL